MNKTIKEKLKMRKRTKEIKFDYLQKKIIQNNIENNNFM